LTEKGTIAVDATKALPPEIQKENLRPIRGIYIYWNNFPAKFCLSSICVKVLSKSQLKLLFLRVFSKMEKFI